MERVIAELIDRIAQLPSDWHGAGTVDVGALRAIAEHAATIGPIHYSVETGSGKTTLLFSHLSAHHLAFALDCGESVRQVRQSPLFNPESVTYVEGPTQQTLPGFNFANRVQIALIDGPHGYPFPDLEYFYFYPIIETGGLLIVDDIAIPTIQRMFEIIKADAMFELLEIVDENMAFFRRTMAPTTDPYSDSWWQQGYNEDYYTSLVKGIARKSRLDVVVGKALRRVSAITPRALKDRVPARMKQRLWRKM